MVRRVTVDIVQSLPMAIIPVVNTEVAPLDTARMELMILMGRATVCLEAT